MDQPTVFTGEVIETLDPTVGRVQALAVSDRTIIAHGDAALAMPGPRVDVGRFAMPGLVDAHTHHAMAGQMDLYELQRPPTATVDELLAAVAERAAGLAPGAWVVGGSWGAGLQDTLSDPAVLDRLDRAAAGRPVMLRDDSKHNRWASTEALRRAGITAASTDPVGGQILRTGGHPNGVLLEAAGALVERALRRDEPMDGDRLAACSARAISLLHAHGVTAFADAAASLPLIRALHALDEAGGLRAWVVSCLLVNDFIFGADPLGEGIIEHREATRSRHHRPDFVKIFLDGVPPSRTGAFLEPYLPDACGHVTTGSPTMTQQELETWLRSTGGRGLGAKIHCTGDASVQMVLDAAHRLRAEGITAPWQIAHGQFIAETDIARFAALDVTAEISPQLWYPGVIPDAIAEVLPADRARRMQPNRALLDAGARVIGGSDWPVSLSPDVWGAVMGLVTRRDPTGVRQGALWPEQGITVDEAIAAYTTRSAAALGLGDVAGSLAVGRSADLISLSHDPWAMPIDELPTIETQATWFAGEQVYAA